ncbi:hypothetical protein AAFP30_28590 [Gordonia sp. CPCC 205515]
MLTLVNSLRAIHTADDEQYAITSEISRQYAMHMAFDSAMMSSAARRR